MMKLISLLIVCIVPFLTSNSHAACALLEGKIVCSKPKPQPGSTLRETHEVVLVRNENLGRVNIIKSLLNTPEAQQFLSSPSDAEKFRSSLEQINERIEADRRSIENLRISKEISAREYQLFIKKYKNSISNYKDGIQIYKGSIFSSDKKYNNK